MHHRQRHIEKILTKRSKMFPVIGLLGPRQVGKSTFLMTQWQEKQSAVYITFDKQDIAVRAQRASEQLLLAKSNNLSSHLIIDEAQKVPHVFDSIKGLIDEKRRVGRFTLSGSVDFSSKSGVRESLAGRMGITRLYPMTLRELSKQEFRVPWVTQEFSAKDLPDPKTIDTWLERGGMPIFCKLSDHDERMTMIHSWLEAICYRDLKQLKDSEYHSDLAFNLLKIFALNAKNPLSQLSLELGHATHVVKKHLEALESLFLIYKIPSVENPRAMPQYRLFDAGVINGLLGGHDIPGVRHNCLISLLINEIYAQYEYAGKLKPELFHYASRGGAEIDLVLKANQHVVGIECSTTVDISPYRQRGMNSFLSKHENAIGYFIAPIQESYQIEKNIFVIPWGQIG